MRYFKRRWNEGRGGSPGSWGASWLLFETDEGGVVFRQVEVYDGGRRLRYGSERQEDECGGLSTAPLDARGWAPSEVDRETFERAWVG